jgi:aspartate ammonia-lyase
VRTGKSIRQIAKERGVLTDAELDALLAPERMTTPKE